MSETTEIPVMDEADVEKLLLERIETQKNMIAAALDYIQAGQPDLAAKVLVQGVL